LRWPRNTLYPQRLALTSPTSGSRSVGIVRLRTTATEFGYSLIIISTDDCISSMEIKSKNKIVCRFKVSLGEVGFENVKWVNCLRIAFTVLNLAALLPELEISCQVTLKPRFHALTRDINSMGQSAAFSSPAVHRSYCLINLRLSRRNAETKSSMPQGDEVLSLAFERCDCIQKRLLFCNRYTVIYMRFVGVTV
jgi:hypothetical protein